MLRQATKPTIRPAFKQFSHERVGALVIEVEEVWDEAKLGRTRVATNKGRNLGNSSTTVEVVRVATKRVEIDRVAIKVPVKAKLEHSP